MQIAIIEFEAFSTNDLEISGSTVSKETIGIMKNEERRRGFWAARCAASSLTRRNNLSYKIQKEENLGFPYFSDDKQQRTNTAFLSLAHTEKIAIAAISSRPIGIDIEKISRKADTAVSRVLSAAEKTFYQKHGEYFSLQNKKISKALIYWVLKESVAKATGLGMTQGLDLFEFDLTRPLPFSVTVPPQNPQGLKKAACMPFIVGEYLLSVCTEEELLLGGIGGRVFSCFDLNGQLEQLDGFKNS